MFDHFISFFVVLIKSLTNNQNKSVNLYDVKIKAEKLVSHIPEFFLLYGSQKRNKKVNIEKIITLNKLRL